jgi:hypothetical protein
MHGNPMSRSRKRTSRGGITSAKSEKSDKRAANRKLRRRVREAIALDLEREVIPEERELSNVWSMARDGKRYFDAPKSIPRRCASESVPRMATRPI